MHQSEPKPVSKPAAMQRIYAQKAKREEDNPEKYKHRLDCYIDKDKDKRFWKTPVEGEPEQFPTGKVVEHFGAGAGQGNPALGRGDPDATV